MKKLLCLLLALSLIISTFASAIASEKHTQMPEIFNIEVVCDEYEVNNGQGYVYKEYLNTSNRTVNEDIKLRANELETLLLPSLEIDTHKKPKRNSRLDVATVYYRTGDAFVSTLMIATNSFKKQQNALLFNTRTYNLNTGETISLSDIFGENSKAWDIISTRVRNHFSTAFGDEPRNVENINKICYMQSLKNSSFTLSGMELTLHFNESDVFENKHNIARVRFFYPEFENMFSDIGKQATDNSKWKMVAITCDDGPKDEQSSLALNAFRKIGARVTYFIVGKQLDRFGYVLRKQCDQNQLFGSHSFNHWSGYSMKTAQRRIQELTMVDDLTIPLVGEKARYFRAPGGTYPPWIEAMLPMPIIQWSLDTYDYTGKMPRAILASVKKNLKEYDIILCHDTGFQMHKAIPLIGQYLNQNGFMAVSMDELIAAKGTPLKDNEVYWSLREGENSESHYNINKKMK